MNFHEIMTKLETNKNSNGVIPKTTFGDLFEILPAVDDGNCLFSSIEQLTSKYNLDELRQLVCTYYKDFDKEGTYPANSPKANLQIQMISDNEEEDDDGNPQLHEDSICNDFQWAGIMDVIALTYILKVNIILMIMGRQGYTVQPYIYNTRSKTIFVKYNGVDHFEPLLPLFEVKSPSVISNVSLTERMRTRSKSKRDSSASSISPETKKLIMQMEQRNTGALASASSVSSETRKLIESMEGLNARGITKRKRTRTKQKKVKKKKVKELTTFSVKKAICLRRNNI
jgi:hypothetical protein